MNIKLSSALIYLFVFVFSTVELNGQTAGSIAFTGFNSDSPDGCAFVALEDLVAPLTVYFTDNEPQAGGGLNGGEGFIVWDLDVNVPAGTIIVFTEIDSPANMAANIGDLTDGSGSLNLATGGDALFAYLGTSETNPTTYLAGVQNEIGNQGDLTDTGLTEGTTFVTFTTSGSPDGGVYTGNRSGETTFADYLPLIGNPSFWNTNNDGTSLLPFSEEVFTIQILPIKLISFDYKKNDQGVRLLWSTESEVNNERFEIEKSSNGYSFSTIGTVRGKGNTSSRQDYSFLDNTLDSRIHYYRLNQIDFDGKHEYSPIIKVENRSNRVKLYPTHIVNTLNVEIEDTDAASLTIFNSMGLVFLNSVLNQEFNTVDISSLPAGIYNVKIESKSQFAIERIIKY